MTPRVNRARIFSDAAALDCGSSTDTVPRQDQGFWDAFSDADWHTRRILTKSSRATGAQWLPSLDFGQQARGVSPQGAGHLKELNHIEPTFAPLHFRDERLRAPELPGQLDLRETLGSAGVGEQAPEASVLAGERRPGHPGSLLFDFGISQNRFIVGGGRDFRRSSSRLLEELA